MKRTRTARYVGTKVSVDTGVDLCGGNALSTRANRDLRWGGKGCICPNMLRIEKLKEVQFLMKRTRTARLCSKVVCVDACMDVTGRRGLGESVAAKFGWPRANITKGLVLTGGRPGEGSHGRGVSKVSKGQILPRKVGVASTP
jgi:hypothetical protein